MPQPLDNVITAAVPDPANHTVTLSWANGATTVNGFAHLLDKGVMRRLVDPEFFAQGAVGERGRSLTWPGEIDFCADALWFETHPEDNPYRERPSKPVLAPQPNA